MGFRTPQILATVALFTCIQQNLSATSCGGPPPCNILGPQSIALTGTVVGTTPSDSSVIVRVDEAFAGLAPADREINVANAKDLEKGHQYLFDLRRGDDGTLMFPAFCGFTDDIGDPLIAADLDYLRKRARGEASTSLSVYVSDALKPLIGATVSIDGPGGPYTGTTGADGTTTFNDIQPAHYSVKVEKDHYHPDGEQSQDVSADVIFGGCRWGSMFSISIRPPSRERFIQACAIG